MRCNKKVNDKHCTKTQIQRKYHLRQMETLMYFLEWYCQCQHYGRFSFLTGNNNGHFPNAKDVTWVVDSNHEILKINASVQILIKEFRKYRFPLLQVSIRLLVRLVPERNNWTWQTTQCNREFLQQLRKLGLQLDHNGFSFSDLAAVSSHSQGIPSELQSLSEISWQINPNHIKILWFQRIPAA